MQYGINLRTQVFLQLVIENVLADSRWIVKWDICLDTKGRNKRIGVRRCARTYAYKRTRTNVKKRLFNDGTGQVSFRILICTSVHACVPVYFLFVCVCEWVLTEEWQFRKHSFLRLSALLFMSVLLEVILLIRFYIVLLSVRTQVGWSLPTVGAGLHPIWWCLLASLHLGGLLLSMLM